MQATSLLSLLLLIQTWGQFVNTALGFEFGDYFFTLFPQDRDPEAMEKNDSMDMPVNFLLFKRRRGIGTPRSMEYMLVDKSKMEDAVHEMQHDLPTMIIIHGFMENIRAKVIDDSIKATTKSGRWNVIFVDWRELAAAPWYRSALLNVRATGKHVAHFIDKMALAMDKMAPIADENHEESSNSISEDASLRKRPSQKFLERLHVIGFSLGSHVAGIAGHHLKTGRIGHITALDPALPMIELLKPGAERIDKADAEFLDVWHTSRWGIQEAIGHVDFYPNGGVIVQPGCEDELLQVGCSHWQAWRFFAASVIYPDSFEAVPCGNWARFQKGYCNKYISYLREKGEVHMGTNVRRSARGKFFLRTTPVFPYSMTLVEEAPVDIPGNKSLT
ncbi:pancreatic lipase-related protein 2-like [Ischnura elegans]|uniref:pancreatic lipase-related protein 2-like n=1 Tax=Ischnura elegans TaxID=197161 RepID=UPI001ED8BF1E|nr:pancreatic lipase-related protein 2-like [Ischnura elegans]